MPKPEVDPVTGQPIGEVGDPENPDLFDESGQPKEEPEEEPTVDELKSQLAEARKKGENLERDYKELQGQTTRKEQEAARLRKQLASAIDPDRANPEARPADPEQRIMQNIKKLEKAIDENKRLGYRTDELEAQKDSTELMLQVIRQNKRNDEFATFYGSEENADLQPEDFQGIGQIMAEYEGRGIPLDMQAAKEIYLGRTSKGRTEAAVKKALEDSTRGSTARGHTGAPLTPAQKTEQDEMRKFAGEIGNPDGVDIPPEAYQNR